MADAGSGPRPLTAREAGLVACRACARVAPAGTAECPRCGAALHSREPASLQRTWAWLLVGLICYIPANLYPMLVTDLLGTRSEQTIMGGVLELVSYGSYGVALIVFVASVMIPVGKFLAIGYLAYSVQFQVRLSVATRIHLYDVVEFIGRWSMIDVFVVAILTALVQLGVIASIQPGPAAVFFALAVVFTMFSAQAMDPRLIWDTADRQAKAAARARPGAAAVKQSEGAHG